MQPIYFQNIRNILREYRVSGHTINHTVFESVSLTTTYTYKHVYAVQKYLDEHPELI